MQSNLCDCEDVGENKPEGNGAKRLQTPQSGWINGVIDGSYPICS
jgi:hypothetical protein